MTLLEPTAVLKIQTTSGGAEDNQDGRSSALAFRINDAGTPGGVPFTASISVSAHDEGGLAVLSAQVRNIPRDVMKLIPPGAIVRIEAGYRNSSSIPVGPVFTGTLNSVLPSRSGTDIVWDIQATSNPMDVINYYVPLSEEEILVGDLLTKLGAGVGVTFNFMDPSPFLGEALYPSYTTEAGVYTEVHDRIIPDLRALTGKPGLVALPSPTNPFQIDVWDMDNVDGIPFISINLDSQLVYSSGISLEQGTATAGVISTDVASDLGTRSALNNLGAQTRINITRVFDPRIYVGLGVQYRGQYEGSGVGVIDEVIHTIQPRRWETQFSAKVAST